MESVEVLALDGEGMDVAAAVRTKSFFGKVGCVSERLSGCRRFRVSRGHCSTSSLRSPHENENYLFGPFHATFCTCDVSQPLEHNSEQVPTRYALPVDFYCFLAGL